MVDIRKLKALIALHGMNGSKVADKLEMSHQKWYYKCKHQSFTLEDVSKLIELLSIDNPNEIFFANEVNQGCTKDG